VILWWSFPRVARCSQPWAELWNPVGILRILRRPFAILPEHDGCSVQSGSVADDAFDEGVGADLDGGLAAEEVQEDGCSLATGHDLSDDDVQALK
jgi:hypothetical protein